MANNLSFSSSSSNKSKNNPNFQPISYTILHDLSPLCSFIISYPLYISYFIFFSPYFIKLISHISPLFVAAVFLSLLLTTTTAFCPELPQFQLGIVQSVIQKLKFNLHDVNGDEDDRSFEDFEIYKIVFDGTLFVTICNGGDEEASPTKMILENGDTNGRRNGDTINDSDSDSDSDTDKLVTGRVPEISIHVTTSEICTDRSRSSGTETVIENSVHGERRTDDSTSDSVTDQSNVERTQRNSFHSCRITDVAITDSDVNEFQNGKGFEKLLAELARFEDLTTANEKYETHTDKVTEALQKAESGLNSTANGADKVTGALRKAESGLKSTVNDKISENPDDVHVHVHVLTSDGSMRETEWRRTLACKLYEERHNSGGCEEGMDSLWEAHEDVKLNSNGGTSRFSNYDDDDDDEEEEEEEMSNGGLCCLQALKLSTGKMNLGMGKLSVVRVSKVFKGFGWLHLAKKKHGNKR